MALRCFAKCPCEAHWWGICRGAQEAIWHHGEKLPRRVPNHHQLGPYEPSTFAGSAHQVNDIPLSCHLLGKAVIWTRHRRRHAANGPLSCSATSVPIPSGDGGGWHSLRASLWVYRHGNHGTRVSCWWFFRPALIPYNFLICAFKARVFMKRSCQTILNKAWSLRGAVFRGAPAYLHGTKVPVATCFQRTWLMVAPVRPTRSAIALCCMASRASASTSCLILVGVGRSIIGTINENWEKYAIFDSNLPQCEGRFGELTIWVVVLDFDDPTWHWSENPAKVKSDFIEEWSQVHYMSISAHWTHINSIHIDFIAQMVV